MDFIRKIEEEGTSKTGFDFEALRKFLEKGLPKPEEGDYAELLNEDDPNSDVVVRRRDGTPVFQMARETWEALRREDAADPPGVVS